MEPIRQRLEAQEDAFATELDELDVDLPEMPEAEAPEEDDEWMYDSDRDFEEQTQEFQRRQGRLERTLERSLPKPAQGNMRP